jgi:uncharacterized repeat protein (TIGR01451 family)
MPCTQDPLPSLGQQIPRKWCRWAHLGWAIALALCVPGPVNADHMPNTLLVTITDNLDPAPTLGSITYAVNVKNSGPKKVTNMVVTSTLPPGTQLLQCSPSCTVGNGTVTSTFASVASNKTVKQSVVVRAPDTDTALAISLSAQATATGAHMGDAAQSTSVAGDTAAVVLLPSLQTTTVACGQDLDPAFFGADTTVQLSESLGCALTNVGLSVSASNVTLDLNRKKIVGDAGDTVPGKIGVTIAAGAVNVTITGRSTSGTSGIEYFDWCIRDGGGNTGLLISQVRCFRARSAAIDIVSTDVEISRSLTDNTIPAAGNTADLDLGGTGGIGIRARGDNIDIKDTIVRRSKVVGIWASGPDADGSGLAVNIEGNLTSMLVETNFGIGIRLEGGPHRIKGTTITGEGFDKGTSTDGVVVEASGLQNTIDQVVVKNHRGNGIVTHGSQTRIERTGVDLVALDGYVSTSTAIGTVLNGNSSKPKRNGFVIDGPDSVLTTNTAEASGLHGFVVTGAHADLSGNKSKANKGDGYVLAGDHAFLDANGAELNTGRGLLVTGNNNILNSTSAKQNKGIGFDVPGGGNEFRNNKAERNTRSEWVIGSGNIDQGGNSANGRTISFTSAGGTFE